MIAEKDVESNVLVVAQGENHKALFEKEVKLAGVNFINKELEIDPLAGGWKVKIPVLARVRYRQPLAKASLYKLQTKNYKLIFDKPQKFIASGQSAVFYKATRSTGSGSKFKNFEMLGGGVII